jgi:hypothetical protein
VRVARTTVRHARRGPPVGTVARRRLRSLPVITSALAPDPSQIGHHEHPPQPNQARAASCSSCWRVGQRQRQAARRSEQELPPHHEGREKFSRAQARSSRISGGPLWVHGLPSRMRRCHGRSTPDSCRLAAPPTLAAVGHNRRHLTIDSARSASRTGRDRSPTIP